MDLGLKGKNAVVLGGTRGIGRAIVETLIADGAHVALCARNAEQVAETVAALKAQGATVTGGAVDIVDAAALTDWIGRAAGELGGIDILVSNAGAMAQGNTREAWEANLRLDVLGGAVAAFDAARPHLEAAAAGGDPILHLSSVASLYPRPGPVIDLTTPVAWPGAEGRRQALAHFARLASLQKLCGACKYLRRRSPRRPPGAAHRLS